MECTASAPKKPGSSTPRYRARYRGWSERKESPRRPQRSSASSLVATVVLNRTSSKLRARHATNSARSPLDHKMRWSSMSLLSTGYHALDGGTRNASTDEGERARVERLCKRSRRLFGDDRTGEDPTTCLGRPADGQPDAGQGQLGAARRSPRSGGGRRTRATPGRGRALEGGGIPAGAGLRGSREPRPHVGHLHHHSRGFSLAGGRLARGALTDAGAIARARQQAR